MEVESYTSTPKMERSYEKDADAALISAEELLRNGDIQGAVEKLSVVEKKSRKSSDIASNKRIIIRVIEMLFEAGDWEKLQDQLKTFSKSTGALEASILEMVKRAYSYLERTPNEGIKQEYIVSLREITEGKIYVEAERAKLTKMLSEIKEGQGKVGEACDIMLEDQIETFGSLNKREKTEFILEQLRLCMAKGDYERAVIVSRKINVSYFKTPNTGDLKLRYYYLMIQYGIHEEQYLEVCKHYYNVFETDEIKLDNKWVVVVQHMVVYAILASYSNEQVDLLNRIKQLSSELEKLPIYSNLLKLFTTQKLISWDKFSTDFLHTLVQSDVFSEQTEGGKIRSTRLHNCVVEHNIRVIASYYSKITLTRLSQLIGLDIDQAEEKVCHLVVTKVIYARIDRPSKIVSFLQPKSVDQELNEWVSDVNSLLMLVEKTSHLIDKEGIVTSITRTL